MGESEENPQPSWEVRFSDFVMTSSDKAYKRAKDSSDSAVIIENMETRRILLQYGTDLLHIINRLELPEQHRERLFEAISYSMLGTFLSGRLGAATRSEVTESLAGTAGDPSHRKAKTGPSPTKRDGITTNILEAMRSGVDLSGEKQEALTARFGEGASRNTVMAAYDQALSIMARENSDKALPDNDEP